MSNINHIKDAYRNGDSYAKIARDTGFDVKTVKKYIMQEDFSPKLPSVVSRSSILDPYKEIINSWLESDKDSWHKQRYTAMKVYKDLVKKEGYTGSYPTIQRYVKKWRQENSQVKAFQDLIWYPGQAQVDCGEADFIVNGMRRRKLYLTMTFPYSNYGLAQVVENQESICVCDALQKMFERIERVPDLLIFDNASGVGKKLANAIMECHFFARFRAHYGFDLRICNPHAGHEKGNVENKVGYVRRNYFVPVPHYTDSERFNRDLLTECESYALETHYEKGELVGELFQEEIQKMRALPKHSFDVCEYMNRTANSYGQVRVDGHYYASRTEDAGRDLLIRLRAREVTIFSPNGSEIASYKRQYEGKASRNVLPELSLKHLSRHPGAWGNSQLRASLNEALRKQLDDLDASTRREILKTLSHLLEEHSFQTLLEALEGVLNREHLDVNAISVLAARIEDGEINMTVNSQGLDLSVYDSILKGALR